MRLIDADALLAEIKNPNQFVEIEAFVKDAPTIDTVQVVRCKDCKWFGSFGCAIRIVDESDRPKENDYCSFGERGESE